MKKEVIRYLSLFSGIGGFEVGIENSNVEMECVGYAEIDKYAASIYERHFPKHINFGDVTKIDTKDLPDFDLLVGGFPCQAFSHAGKRRGFDDTRGTLFFEIARILKDKRPRYFLLENVKGLLSHDKGKTFQTVLGVLSDLGYFVKWEVHNSKDYVPQNRERIFIEGYFREECGGEVLSFRGNDEKDHGGLNETKINKVGNINPNKPHQSGDVYGTDGLARCLTSTDSQHPHYILDTEKLIKLNDKAQAQTVYDINGLSCTLSANGGGQGGKTGLYLIPKEHEDARKIKVIGNTTPSKHASENILSKDGISRCLTATDYKHPVRIIEGNDEDYLKLRETTKKGYKEAYPYDGVLTNRGNRKIAKGIVRDGECGCLQTAGVWGTVTSDYRIRKLTPRECERLQAFPDDWTRWGKDGEEISNTQRYKCCGNAVTTVVITAIINRMFGEA